MTLSAKSNESGLLQCISPVDGSIFDERSLHSNADIDASLTLAQKAFPTWRTTPLADKQKIILKMLDWFLDHADEIGTELTWQMGRPISQSAGEIKGGFQERIRALVDLAPKALADITPTAQEGIKRYVKREPLGTVAIIAPWNFPYLTALNGIVPALLSGNTVILKHSQQTPKCADRFLAAFQAAGLPEGVFQTLDLSHAGANTLMSDPRVNHVVFTGSVAGGHAVQNAINNKFINAGLELGGNDAAYVRADADLPATIENLVDGAFFNSGQSCCGIERIYVHTDVYDDFVKGFVELTKQYKLGNPLEDGINLGPMSKTSAADHLRERIQNAISLGARALIDEKLFPASKAGTPYLAPQVLVDVHHAMPFMKQESFGPVVGIMRVKSDADAITLINDSDYGLTASIWTQDINKAEQIADFIETGTVFMNRCDYVDPGLCWTGVKNTGKGAGLGLSGFEQLTRPKAFHLKAKL